MSSANFDPYAPTMAMLPPNSATIQAYSYVGSLAVLLWDILSIVFQALVIVTSAPVGNCDLIQKISYIYPITITSTLFLFVLRVCALYDNNRYIIGTFSVLWVAVLVTTILVPFGVSGYKIPGTLYCIEVKTDLALGFTYISPFVHDTLIFIATSWAFMRNSYENVSVKNGFRVMLLGKYLPAFSKSILRDGQAYYLFTLLFNIGVLVLSTIRYPLITPCTLGIPLFVLINTMGCHIYRNVRLRLYQDYTITSSVIQNSLQRLPVVQPSGSAHELSVKFKHTTVHTNHDRSLHTVAEGNTQYGDSQDDFSQEDIEKQEV